jgi:hypothetical protein
MNWKTRQMFSDREHGIVSGLSPVNMAGGGTVPYPSYQGGTSPEEAEYIDAAQAGAMAGGPLKKGEQPFDAGITQEELDLHTTYYDVSQDTAALEEFEALSIEQRVAELAAKMGISVPEARAMILNQMLEQQGVTLSEEVINQFAAGLITLQDALSQAVDVGSGEDAPFEAASWKEIWEGDINNPMYDKNTLGNVLRYPLSAVTTPMQKGMGELAELLGQVGIDVDPINTRLGKQAGTGLGEAMAIDLFQQGDEEINEPLNRMVQSTNPSIADITPTETVGEAVTVTEDQGPTDTEAAKAPFQQMAVEVIKEATMSLAREDYMNIEQVQQEVEQQLTAIDETYRQQTGATDTILTEEFLAQLDNLMVNAGDEFDTAPGMKEGTDEETATTYDINSLITSMAGKGVDPAKIEEIIKKYYPGGTGMSEEMLQNRISRARRGALLGGKTKQGGWAGMMDILGQADAAEVAAIGSMPETLATNEAALKRLAMSGELEAAGGVGAGGMTADAKKMLMMQAIMGDPNMPQDTKDMLLKGLAGLKPGKEQKIDLIKSFMKDLLSKSPNDQKKTLGKKPSDPAPTEQEIAAWAANLANAILGSLSGKTRKR